LGAAQTIAQTWKPQRIRRPPPHQELTLVQRKLGCMIRTFQGIQPTIPASAYVDPSAQVIGDVILGENASIWMNAVLRGDVHSIRIGAGSNIQDCAVLHGMKHLYPVIVGERCTIGHNATVHGCILEDDVLIGIGAIVLNAAHIGAGSIVAAGAVIPEHTIIPPRSLVAGVPGKVRRALTDADLALIRTYATNYLGYTKVYLSETGSSI
jgi:carbonic anhydrase/acetyltransferase-like protein (isoleucine patch superfamily)